MNRLFKYLIIALLYFSMFSTIVFAENILDDIYKSITQEKIQCLKSKSKNFIDYPAQDRIILIYLNSILDSILDNNKVLLDSFQRSKSEFCILLDKSAFDKQHTGFQSSMSGLIKLGINENFLQYIPISSDTDIVAQLSHEIAHDLLKHYKKKYEMIMKINDQYLKQIESKNGILDFTRYSYTHPDYINLLRRHEIEADNLGFQIYLNSGFKLDRYGDFFIKIEIYRSIETRKNPSKIKEEFSTFKKLLHDEQIDLTMNNINIKYHKPDQDIHPSGYWRAWNVYKQEKEFLKNKSIYFKNQTTNLIYFRIDLSRSKKLDDIRKFFNKKENSSIPVDYSDINDPRAYILHELFKDNSEISYTIELNSNYLGSIGSLLEDNSMIVRANDIFYTLALMYSNRYREYLSQCVSLFLEN